MAVSQLIKTGSIVHGKKRQYQITQTILVDDNCVSYLCKDSSGNVYIMDHYQVGCPILGEPRERFLSLPRLKGIIPVFDSGSEMGLAFDIFPKIGTKLSDMSRSLVTLIQYIIPQLNFGIASLHRQGLLLRAVSPDCAVYDDSSHGAWFCSFQNIATINNGATATKASSKGIKAQYYPPEYQNSGWSVYSDYYAFGIMLLEYAKGINLFSNIPPNSIIAAAKTRQLPGIDRNRVEKTSYSLLSTEERILYLILGLTLPDPHQRWGFNEVRCWCAGQEIPLVQTGEKVQYQMSVPFVINGKKNWDYSQVSMSLAKLTSVSEPLLPAIITHISKQNIKLSESLKAIVNSKDYSAAGKVFYFVYTLNPLLSGFWWKGNCYKNSNELVFAYQKGDKNPLKEMLKNHCFSSLTKLRGLKTEQQKKEYSIFRQLEQWEIEEPDKGASRFVMQLGGSQGQRFQFDGTYYSSLESVLSAYSQKGMELYKKSKQLLQERSFHSWLWAKGYQGMAQSVAAKVSDDNDAFYSLLSICEKVCTDAGKKAARIMYMRWGPFAEITWLKEHLNYYEANGGISSSIIQQVRNSPWSAQMSLESLVQSARNHILDYQNFVRNTSRNPFLIIAGLDNDGGNLIIPIRSDAFFCCSWRQSEVTPAFLKWIGEPVPKDSINAWCDSSIADANDKITQEEEKVKSVPGFADYAKSPLSIQSQVMSMVAWLISLFLIFVISITLHIYQPLLIPILIISGWFPIQALFWCHSYSFGSNKSDSELDRLQQRLNVLEKRKRNIGLWNNDIKKDLTSSVCGAKLKAESSLGPLMSSSEIKSISDSLSGGVYKASLIVSNASMAIIPMLLIPFWASPFVFVFAITYCVIAISLLTTSSYTCSRAFGCTLIIQISNYFLYSLFHTKMVIGAIVVLIIIVTINSKS